MFNDKANIDNYFSFLKDSGFKGPYEYNYVREVHTDFIKGQIIIKIVFEGDYWVSLIKTKKYYPEIEIGKIKSVDIDFNKKHYYNLSILDNKKQLFNSVSFTNAREKELWYYSTLIKQNQEILNGNLFKLSILYRFLKIIGLKK